MSFRACLKKIDLRKWDNSASDDSACGSAIGSWQESSSMECWCAIRQEQVIWDLSKIHAQCWGGDSHHPLMLKLSSKADRPQEAEYRQGLFVDFYPILGVHGNSGSYQLTLGQWVRTTRRAIHHYRGRLGQPHWGSHVSRRRSNSIWTYVKWMKV